MSLRIAHNRREIAPGTRFGDWQVLRVAGLYGQKKNLHYECLCACGAKVLVNGDNLRRGVTQRCHSCWVTRNRLRPYESLFNFARKYAMAPTSPKQKPHVFTITYEEFCTLIAEGRCHYCWTPLTWSPYMKKTMSVAYQIDRKDNNLGYVPGNVAACCQRCNYAKSNAFTYEEWITMTECFRRLS